MSENLSKNAFRKLRRVQRLKQKKTNAKLKKKLFGHLFFAPCCYCRYIFLWADLTIEHLTPLSLGGTNDHSNIALACEPCNKNRGREALQYKKLLNKKYHEEYYAKYHQQNRQGTLQEPFAPNLHCEG